MTPLLAPRSPASWRALTSAHRQAVYAARAQKPIDGLIFRPVEMKFVEARTRRAEATARVMRREVRP